MFNFQASVHCVQRCLVVSPPCGCEALLRKKHFKVNFVAFGNYWMRVTMFNTFTPDVLNSLQNKNSGPVLYTNFEF